jgi:predicted glycoside hydrolase/deacetylase ChbG (UPF0249 family)
MLRFALCADDYALTPGVSRGILDLLAAGRLTAVSVMVTEAGWPQAARDLRALGASADVGLHFNLTLGSPLGAMPQLAAGGTLPPLGLLLRSALLGRLSLAEVEAEVARQIDAFAQAFGRLPDYVDGHQHVHALPGIRDAVVGTVTNQGPAGRVWLRDPGDRLAAILRRPMRRKALAVAALTAGFAELASTRRFAVNKGFAGFSDFDATRDYGLLFAAALRAPGARHLVMCHPGYTDDALARLDPASSSREAELAFLRSPAFPDVLAAHSAELIRLSESLASH